jgi:hypothetical protein
MARWTPGDAVKPAEVIGRRIFGKDPTTPLDIHLVNPNLFYDTRFEEDLSLDRLGEGQPHKSAVNHLTRACDVAATEQATHFVGWVAAQCKNIKFEHVRPDPLTIEKDGIDNPFHALLDRSSAREKVQAWRLSRSLFMDFKEHGQMVAPSRRKSEAPA